MVSQGLKSVLACLVEATPQLDCCTGRAEMYSMSVVGWQAPLAALTPMYDTSL